MNSSKITQLQLFRLKKIKLCRGTWIRADNSIVFVDRSMGIGCNGIQWVVWEESDTNCKLNRRLYEQNGEHCHGLTATIVAFINDHKPNFMRTNK